MSSKESGSQIRVRRLLINLAFMTASSGDPPLEWS